MEQPDTMIGALQSNGAFAQDRANAFKNHLANCNGCQTKIPADPKEREIFMSGVSTFYALADTIVSRLLTDTLHQSYREYRKIEALAAQGKITTYAATQRRKVVWWQTFAATAALLPLSVELSGCVKAFRGETLGHLTKDVLADVFIAGLQAAHLVALTKDEAETGEVDPVAEKEARKSAGDVLKAGVMNLVDELASKLRRKPPGTTTTATTTTTP